jgi:hypothetical protein
VQAIGCQVGGPAWVDGARLLRGLPSGQADLGLHLDLTERPLAPDQARPLGRLIADAYGRRLDLAALRRQVRAQLDAFAQALGRAPDYVDGHQHVHQLPGVRDVLLAELAALQAQAQTGNGPGPWLRATRAPAGLARAGLPWFKPRVIEALGAAGLASRMHARGLAGNRCLLGVYDFSGGPGRYARLLAGWLRAMAPGDLLMCHPGSADCGAAALGGARHAEFQVLSGDGFGALCRQAGVDLQPMSRILGASR